MWDAANVHAAAVRYVVVDVWQARMLSLRRVPVTLERVKCSL